MDILTALAVGSHVLSKGVAENLPIIRTILSVGGTVITPIWACKSTLIAKDIVDRVSAERGGAPISKGEIIELTWPHFVGPTLLGLFTIYNEIENTRELLGRIATTTAIAAASNKALEDYRAKNKELFGENKDKKINEEIAEDKVKALAEKSNGNLPFPLSGETLLFIDGFSGRPFRSTIQKVRSAIVDINESLIPGGTWSSENQMTLNDFYASIEDPKNLGPLEAGYNLGWITGQPMKYDIKWKQYNENNVAGYLKYNLIDLATSSPVMSC